MGGWRRFRSHPRSWPSRLARLGLWLAVGFLALSMVLVLALRWLPAPGSSVMLQQALAAVLSGEPTPRYQWVPLERISPPMALAAVAAEDQKFLAHWGFDLASIRQALKDRADGGRLRGASTISQQVAKNLFLWSGRSWLRKGLEAWFTLLVEALWPKRRILEVYLNIVELGEYTFGAEAASQRFFRKPAQELNRREAALLAAVLPNPRRYRVEAPSAYVRDRQRWILGQMTNLGSAYLDRL